MFKIENNFKLTAKLKRLLIIIKNNDSLNYGGIAQRYFSDKPYNGSKINKRNSTIASWISKLQSAGLVCFTRNKLTPEGELFLSSNNET